MLGEKSTLKSARVVMLAPGFAERVLSLSVLSIRQSVRRRGGLQHCARAYVRAQVRQKRLLEEVDVGAEVAALVDEGAGEVR